MNIISTVFLILVVSIIMVIGLLLWVRKKLQAHTAWNYRVDDPNGIELLESVKIGGVEQWIHVRGRNKNNPLLLFIHGGPAAPHIGWHDAIQRSWENHFTIVQWDQRQTGKSYAKGIGHTISHQQYIQDADEMLAYLRQRFNQDKLFVMGTSYGTYLGMHMVKKRPDWLHAYIGVGQSISVSGHAIAGYDLLLEYAKSTSDTQLREKLENLAPYPDPNNPANSFLQNAADLMEEESKRGKCYPKGFFELGLWITTCKWVSPHYLLIDHWYRLFGDKPAPADPENPFYLDFYEYDLLEEVGSSFDVPIFFFSGKDDFHIPYSYSDSWYEKIQAPYKEHVIFDDSAHTPFITEPFEFANALITKVLPFATTKKSNVDTLGLNENHKPK